ncbi:malonyl-CoA:anthocyanidin 5-O-glucoside-6''-O-malonyltransferase-like [Gastrolobium bilobum]|uniref:malonyl-CoA:anthocyanidin 5-O-glucoside-6''-O-malonyltransferase-like n=1 Tax=Gastrolobium bilobum TaxID=150636 RepID=UPI002AB321D9|nr:malonyl-CoA:anthocyanidin 5-O-glucoside-6''-O-malonyltransferase-like [Gastrolobium bilobum]
MASPNNSIKIHQHCFVAPSSSTNLSLPLTFFDLLRLRYYPVERIFFYSLPLPHSNPSFFYEKVVPKLKTSLSLILQHFLPLAGNIVWPSDSQKPFIQYNPGDGVSLVLAEYDADFNLVLDNSPREAIESRSFVPHLESSDSLASVISLQITLFPNSGFCIGISTHHAVLDGKSSTMFTTAWASLCKSGEESPSLVRGLEPFFDREVIKDPNGLDFLFINNSVQETKRDKQKFAFAFSMDCRARLEPPIPENYVGNCVSSHIVDTQQDDFIKEDGVVIVAEKIYSKLKMLDKRALDGAETLSLRLLSMLSEGVEIIGVSGSTRFGVYETDFGWGRPAKVEITSLDRGLNIGIAESKDGKSGVEVGLVLNKHAMDLFFKHFLLTTLPLFHMAPHKNNNNNIKIHEHNYVAPPSSATETSILLTVFDMLWLRFHPVERVFFYSLNDSHSSDPSFLFDKVVPRLKTSLSLTLQHFLPLAGNIVWPSDSEKPIIKYTPGDGVSMVIAESDADFNHIMDNSPHELVKSRSLVPHLESSDSLASVISLQITLFPNSGFSIGISTHHAVLDGKSSTMFIKAWASLCQNCEESPSLVQELVPFLNREVIKDPSELSITFTNNWTETLTEMFPKDNSDGRCLKILPFQPKLEDTVRATFELTRGDLEKLKAGVLSKWDMVEEGAQLSKPHTLSSFVLTCAYVSVCIAKAIQGVEKDKDKFAFAFAVDCRARLEPPIPENYFGNCVWGHFIDTQPRDYTKEDGFVIVAKCIHNKIKSFDKGVFGGTGDAFSRLKALKSEGVELMGLAGSNRFGVYGTDFGWGRPAKVEIISVDRGLTFGLAESKDGKCGVEVGLVLNKNVMEHFNTLFHGGLRVD